MSNNERVLIEAKRKGYYINDEGQLYNPKGKEVKGCICKHNGYRQAALRILEFQSFKLMFHRIQAYKKYGKAMFKEGIEVRHLNNNKLDNSLSNIAIGTHSDNMMDLPKEKRVAMSGKAKYNHKEVMESINKGKSYSQISEELNIPIHSVGWIKRSSVESRKFV